MKKKQTFNDEDESFVSPKLSPPERLKAEQEFAEYRRQAELKTSDEEKLLSKILELKFQMEDYLKSEKLEEQRSFGYFLRRYIELIGRKNNEFAEEIDVNPTELSQIVNRHRDPSKKIIIRLEMHSNGIILATAWHGIYSKDKALELATDEQLRREEGEHVKKKLALSFKSHWHQC